jgi:hypothetical protein
MLRLCGIISESNMNLFVPYSKSKEIRKLGKEYLKMCGRKHLFAAVGIAATRRRTAVFSLPTDRRIQIKLWPVLQVAFRDGLRRRPIRHLCTKELTLVSQFQTLIDEGSCRQPDEHIRGPKLY